MAQSEAEKTAALQAALKKLERQAEKTNKSLKTVLELPEAKKLADQVDQITKAIAKQLEVREDLDERVQASKKALEALDEQQKSMDEGSEKHLAVLKKLHAEEDRLKALRATQLKQGKETAKTLSTNTDIAAKYADVIEKLNAGLEVQPELLAAANKELKEFNDQVTAGDELAEGLKDQFLGLSGGMAGLAKLAKGGIPGLKALGSNFLESANPESAEGTIARKTYYSMGEVCKLCHLESHVLRYWETQFPSLKPKKNRAGNRVFKHKDIDLIFLIKHLLYEKKFTIEGACQQIKRLSDTADQKSGETGDPDDRYF